MVYFIPFQVATSGVEKVQKCTKLVPQGNYTLYFPFQIYTIWTKVLVHLHITPTGDAQPWKYMP